MVATLRKLCFDRITNHILDFSPFGLESSILSGTVPTFHAGEQWIPLGLSQEIFDSCMSQVVAEGANRIMKWFLENPRKSPLAKLCLQNNPRADVNLIYGLVKGNLKTLTNVDVRGCRTLPSKFWRLLNTAPNLTLLKTTKLSVPLQCPNLEMLVVDWSAKNVIHRVQRRIQANFYDKLIENVLPSLKHLDLSWCPWVKKLKGLNNGKKLEVLILRNCDITYLADPISQLTELRVLDVSVGLESESSQDNFNGVYSKPETLLRRIVMALPKLESLDISGTNLDRADIIPGVALCESGGGAISALESRCGFPLEFVGLYSTFSDSFGTNNAPANVVSGSGTAKALLEAIKRNCDMPKTLLSQLIRFRAVNGTSEGNLNDLLIIQTNLMKTLRLNEYFRHWALKCMYNFLDGLENPAELVAPEVRREAFLVLNRLIHSYPELENIPEIFLCFTFQIYFKLLPDKESVLDVRTSREITRLAKFLVSLNTMRFTYLKTETLLFRTFYRMSLEQNVCMYLSKNKAVARCLDFFKSLQLYVGLCLSPRQTSEILPLVWRSILNFMKVSHEAECDFFQNQGLHWMNAHISWFTREYSTHIGLQDIFMEILTRLESHAAVSHEFNKMIAISSSNDLFHRLKNSFKVASEEISSSNLE